MLVDASDFDGSFPRAAVATLVAKDEAAAAAGVKAAAKQLAAAAEFELPFLRKQVRACAWQVHACA